MINSDLERIEELKHNEELLYNCINYLIGLWDFETKDKILEHFKDMGFSEEDLERIGINDLY